MKEVKLIEEYGAVQTVLEDIFYNENDLFNEYVDYEILNIEKFNDYECYNIQLNFNDTDRLLTIEKHVNDNTLHYDVNLSNITYR